MIEVPYLDLGKIHDEIREELDTAYHQVMDREWFIGGEEDKSLSVNSQIFVEQKHVWVVEMDWMRFA